MGGEKKWRLRMAPTAQAAPRCTRFFRWLNAFERCKTKSQTSLLRRTIPFPQCCGFVGKGKDKANYEDYGPYDDDYCGPTFGFAFDLAIFDGHPDGNYVNHCSESRYPLLVGNELCGGHKFDKNLDEDDISFVIKKIETYQIIVADQ